MTMTIYPDEPRSGGYYDWRFFLALIAGFVILYVFVGLIS